MVEKIIILCWNSTCRNIYKIYNFVLDRKKEKVEIDFKYVRFLFQDLVWFQRTDYGPSLIYTLYYVSEATPGKISYPRVAFAEGFYQ